MLVNYYIGRVLEFIGYKIIPSYKSPVSTANPLELAYLAIKGQNNKPVQIIQIGAFDGKLSDPLKKILIKNNTINVLFVEPQPEPFEKLRKMYENKIGFSFENCAVTKIDGPTLLHLPLNDSYSPKASLNLNHFQHFSISKRKVKTIGVQGLTVSSLLSKHNFNAIDILQIDTEGQDYQILKQFFKLKIFPAVVNIESFHLDKKQRKELRNDLTTNGYQYIDIEFDTFSIHRSLFNT